MIQLILMVSMSASQVQNAKSAQARPPILAEVGDEVEVQPCNWPNPCAVKASVATI